MSPPQSLPFLSATELRIKAERLLRDRRPHRPRDVGREIDLCHIEIELQTEQLRQMESSARGLAGRYRQLFEQAPVAYLTLDGSGAVVALNDAARTLVGELSPGCPVAEVLAGGPDSGLLEHQASGEGWRDARLAGDGRPVQIRLTPLGDQDAEAWLLVLLDAAHVERAIADRNRAIRDHEALLAGVETGTARTGWEATAEILNLTRHTLEVLSEVGGEAVIVTGVGGRVIWVTRAAEALFRRSAEELRAHPACWMSNVHPDDQGLLTSLVARDGESSPEVELRLVHDDDRLDWVRLRWMAFPDRHGDPLHALIGRDITHRKRAEAQAARARQLEAVAALAQGAAHDFGNVLQGILGVTTFLQQNATDPEAVRQDAELVRGAVDRGRALVRKLLLFGRRDARDDRVVEVDTALARLAGLLQKLVGQRVRLTTDLAAPEATIRADAIQVDQIVINLAVNARDAMPDGGDLALRTRVVVLDREHASELGLRVAGPYLRLEVADTGAGMDDATLARIFEPFFTTKGPNVGTGLGLTGTQSLIHGMGGTIHVRSTLGEGTIAVVHLPLTDERASDQDDVTLQPSTFSGTALVLEDDPLVRGVIGSALRRLGFMVVEATAAEVRDNVLPLEGLDLLVTDQLTPGTTVPEQLEPLRRQVSPLGVVVLSAADRTALAGQGIVLDHDIQVLQKPFELEQLARAVALALPDRGPA
ncbi:MAG: PAS domain-containing protein [Myxococcales bacterium]|nr:PAS domain-containing protein [Myxococcales bacterium]